MERRCSDAFAAVQHFEKTHCLALQHMALPYLQRRPQLVATCLNQAAQLGLKDEVSHDAVLLMDRTMSTGLEVRSATTQKLCRCLDHASLPHRGSERSTTSRPWCLPRLFMLLPTPLYTACCLRFPGPVSMLMLLECGILCMTLVDCSAMYALVSFGAFGDQMGVPCTGEG